MEYVNDILGLKLSIKEASTYTKISEKNYIQMIKEGYFPILEEEIAEIPAEDDENYDEDNPPSLWRMYIYDYEF